MSSYIKHASKSDLSRRNFIQLSAATTVALAASGSLVGCNNSVQAAPNDTQALGEEKWVTIPCWHGCGTCVCRNAALIKDGVVIRQKTDDTHEDSVEWPQRRGCLRGRSQRKQVFSADRLKYPMKRKHWEPLSGGDKSLRGKDEWERISWDEALDYVSAEIKHVIDTYGNAAIFADGGDIDGLLNTLGGYTSVWGTHSFGSWSITPMFIGFNTRGQFTGNDRLDLTKAETVVMFGVNPAWSSGGNATYFYQQIKEAGAKFIGIDPVYNESFAYLDASWIPVYPGQDDALILGIAHVLITEDDPESNPLIDWDFLDRCTIGFDADHMPEGEDSKGNFKDYVLGTFDGIPKSPEWASERCGASPEQIKDLAYELRPDKNVAILTSWSTGRVNDSDHISHFFMTLGAMTGHIGKSGNMCGISCDSSTCDGGPRLFTVGSKCNPEIEQTIDDCINSGEMWEAIINGEYTYNGRMTNYGFTNLEVPGEKRTCDIHLIYSAGRALLGSRENIMRGVEAFRKVDFVVSHSYAPNATALYSDIVLPINTPWEREGRIDAGGNRDTLIYQQAVLEPLYESQSDQWIARGLADRFDISHDQLFCGSEKQQLFNQIAGTTIRDEDGVSDVLLVTITQEDIDAWNVEGKPQTGKITLAELSENGVYTIPRKEGDKYGHIAWKDFREDPENNPMENSESGKMEIYSKGLSEALTSMGYSEVGPIPEYKPKTDGFEDTFADFENKEKGEYPYQVISRRSLRTVLTSLNNIPQLREAIVNPVVISAHDAQAEGIATGDAIKISSPYGAMVRMACVSERVVPGVIGVPYGGWLEYDEKAGADMGGAHNVLTGSITSGQGISGYNSGRVNIEKFTGDFTSFDVDKPQDIIFEEGE